MISKELEKKLEKYNLILVYENVSRIEYNEKNKALIFYFANNIRNLECHTDYIDGVIDVYVFKNIRSLINFFEKRENNLILIKPKYCSLNSFFMYDVKYVFSDNLFTELFIIL